MAKCRAFSKYLISRHARNEHLTRTGVVPKRHGYSDEVIAIINRAVSSSSSGGGGRDQDNNKSRDKENVKKQ